MSIITVCRSAWNSTKKDHQPAFDDLVLPYQNMLQRRAEGAIASGVVTDDGPLASFDRAAMEQSYLVSELPVEVKEELVEEMPKADMYAFGSGDGSAPKLESMGLGPTIDFAPTSPPKPKPRKKAEPNKTAKKLAETKSTKKGASKKR